MSHSSYGIARRGYNRKLKAASTPSAAHAPDAPRSRAQSTCISSTHQQQTPKECSASHNSTQHHYIVSKTTAVTSPSRGSHQIRFHQHEFRKSN
ncbi:hypothetical protein Nepgr_024743 [Nepenthes gracilis]|uniref:Uncharacterized protein n=1 Tax=Nepenthes gracilis TaxID=150966 RepID=A0AAD3T4Q0_NEPGR|nr:hypothetical protein Nepgr_024743 [Nepenthes gracilis]